MASAAQSSGPVAALELVAEVKTLAAVVSEYRSDFDSNRSVA